VRSLEKEGGQVVGFVCVLWREGWRRGLGGLDPAPRAPSRRPSRPSAQLATSAPSRPLRPFGLAHGLLLLIFLLTRRPVGGGRAAEGRGRCRRAACPNNQGCRASCRAVAVERRRKIGRAKKAAVDADPKMAAENASTRPKNTIRTSFIDRPTAERTRFLQEKAGSRRGRCRQNDRRARSFFEGVMGRRARVFGRCRRHRPSRSRARTFSPQKPVHGQETDLNPHLTKRKADETAAAATVAAGWRRPAAAAAALAKPRTPLVVTLLSNQSINQIPWL